MIGFIVCGVSALIMARRRGRRELDFDGRLPQLEEHCHKEHSNENNKYLQK